MSGLPPVPRDEAGPCPDKDRIMSELRSGILGACCVCDHATGWWWQRDRDYYPMHDRCVERLIELWAQTEDVVARPVGPVRRTGAYARRAATLSTSTSNAPIEPARSVRISRDGGSPYFRPGMPVGAPWVACVLTTANMSVVPCSNNEASARGIAARWAASARAGHPYSNDAEIVGSWVVGPDGVLSPIWGQTVAPDEALPWERLTRLRRWEDCRGCGARMWPGRWRGDVSGHCLDCLRPVSTRPSWPPDSERFEVDPATIPVKKVRRQQKVRIVD
jgi:hypothetical protein